MRPEDRAYLWDMREAVTDIASVVTTLDALEFEEARLVRFGVERLVIILGESAACVSEDCRCAGARSVNCPARYRAISGTEPSCWPESSGWAKLLGHCA